MKQQANNQTKAAERLGINRNTLYKKVTDYEKAQQPGETPEG
jgi:DNA-binding protein Fis